MSIEELKKIDFAFIIGRGRSGTTLLRTMLNANATVISPFESKVIIHVKQKYDSIKNWNREMVVQFVEDLYSDVKFEKIWNIDKEILINKIFSFPIEQLNFELLIKIVYLCFPTEFEKSTIKLIADKNPPYVLFLKDLNNIFPNAKYIHLIRDYRDNIQSIKKTDPIKNINFLSHGWLNDNLRIEEFKVKYPKKVHTIRYEDLVDRPSEILKEVCIHLGIHYSENMVSFQGQLKKEIDNNLNIQKEHKTFIHFHGNLTKPVNSESIGKWKKDLTEKEVIQIEYICKAYGEKYNYLPTRNSKGNFWESKWGLFRYRINNFVMISYYNLPFLFRRIIRLTTKFLFQKFGYTTIYNQMDYSIINEE